jgi:hypothetical protein
MHCIVCHSSVYGYFWLPFGIFWTFYCLSFIGLRLFLITLWYLLDIALSVILREAVNRRTDNTMAKRYQRVMRSPNPNIRMTDNTMVKRYQRVIRSSCKPKNDRQYNGQKIPVLHLRQFFIVRIFVKRATDYSLVSFGHCIVCHSSVYGNVIRSRI